MQNGVEKAPTNSHTILCFLVLVLNLGWVWPIDDWGDIFTQLATFCQKGQTLVVLFAVGLYFVAWVM